jgi:hypothetical protein
MTCGTRRRAVTPRDRSRAWLAAPRVRPTRSAGVPPVNFLLNGRWFPPPASRLRSPGSRTPVAPRPRPVRRLLAGRGTGRLVARLVLGAVRGILPPGQPPGRARPPATRPPPRACPRATCVPRPAAWLPARSPARRRRQLEHLLRPGRERDMPPMQAAAAAYERLHLAAQGVQVDVQRAQCFAATPSPSWISLSRLRVPGLGPARSCRTPRPASRPRRRARAGIQGRAPPARAPKGWRGLIAGSMQHGAPLGHEVEEFDGG